MAASLRIALIAMSGVRACDPELMALGLTLLGFVERGKLIASLPSLGLLTLAGLTPKHHQQRYIEVTALGPNAGEQTLLDLPTDVDLVAISSLSAQIHDAYRVAEHYIQQGITVVMGGLHVTSVPHEAIARGITAVVGEGEPVWLDLLSDAEQGQLKPLYDARGRSFDLARAPLPAIELLDLSRYNRLTVQTSRGCPWQCSFCASSILLTRHYKQKPIERVLAEVDAICARWPNAFIELADDNAFVNARYWKALLPALAERHVRWFAESDLSIHEDPELLDLMRRAGCAQVLIGFESPNAAGLAGLELRRDWKRRHVDSYRQAVQTIQSHGITVNACFVIGLDGQGPEIFDQVRAFVADVAPYDVQITLPTAFPGTPYYQQMLQAGRLIEPEAWERCTLFDLNVEPTEMSTDELRAGFKRLVVDLYSQDATDQRRQAFRHQRQTGGVSPKEQGS